MRLIRRAAPLAFALSIGAAFGLLAEPATTLASCTMIPLLEDAIKTADIVFVGTVVETANRNTWATVQVEEVWRGPDQPARVVVQGGPAGNAATSIDRSFAVGVKYLFFPRANDAGALGDNICSNTTEWSAELAGLRPADARAPIGSTPPPAGFDVMSVAVPAGMALLVAGLLVGVGLLARGRDRA
jgi:hypothetical protein